MFTNVWT